MESNKLVCAYVRISNEDLDKNKDYSVSIYNQLSLIKEYGKRMGLKIDKEYIDDGYSGINFERPGFESLRNDVDDGKVAVIITKDKSRLGREFIESAYYISEYFPKYNVRYISINDNYDSEDPNNSQKDLMLAVQSIINDRFIKETSTKLKATFKRKTEEGNYLGFTAPYGYKVVKYDDKRTLEIDDYSSKIVKRIFTDIASGKSRNQVAQELNDEKIVPPVIYMNMTPSKNKKYYYDWSDKIVYRILKNETYTGKTVVRKSVKNDYRKKKRTVIPIRDRETISNTHPAIITESLFEEANSMLKSMKRKEKNNYDGTLSGLVICGVCGRKMTACMTTKESGNKKYYFACTRVEDRKKCPNRILYDNKLRNIVSDSIKSIILNYVDEDVVVDEVLKKVKHKERYTEKINDLKREIELININVRELYLQKTKNQISINEFIEKKNEQTKIKEVKEKLLEQLTVQNDIEYRKNKILKTYNSFVNGETLMKDYIKDLIDKIIIYKDNTLKIVYKFGISEPKTIRLY